jgi:hypothetical protein
MLLMAATERRSEALSQISKTMLEQEPEEWVSETVPRLAVMTREPASSNVSLE